VVQYFFQLSQAFLKHINIKIKFKYVWSTCPMMTHAFQGMECSNHGKIHLTVKDNECSFIQYSWPEAQHSSGFWYSTFDTVTFLFSQRYTKHILEANYMRYFIKWQDMWNHYAHQESNLKGLTQVQGVGLERNQRKRSTCLCLVNGRNCKFTCCFIWMQNLVSHFK